MAHDYKDRRILLRTIEERGSVESRGNNNTHTGEGVAAANHVRPLRCGPRQLAPLQTRGGSQGEGCLPPIFFGGCGTGGGTEGALDGKQKLHLDSRFC